MRLKKVVLACFLLLGFLNFSLLIAQDSGQKKIEISILGGYTAGAGVLTAESIASDLLTGYWSPWFGAGHPRFSWMTPAPEKLDTPLGASNLAKEPSFLAGVRLGFNVTPMFQIELFYQYGFSAYKIDDTSWDAFAKTKTETLASFQNIPGRNPNFMDNSVQAAGKTNMFGLNFNISFPTQSAITPYFSLGGGMMTFSDFPAISFSLTQSVSASSSATYTMDVTYTSKSAFFFGAGVGLKIPLGDNFGVKAEARGNLAMLSFDKNLATTFISSAGGGWTTFTNYDKVVLTEKGTSFLIGGALGLYYCF